MNREIKIHASILNANTAFLGEAVKRAENSGVSTIHIDIMDGHYVKNFSFGPQIIKDLKDLISIEMDVHLETNDPESLIEIFAESGIKMLSFQLDACKHPIQALKKIKAFGLKTGIGINVTEDLTRVAYLLKYLDAIILMSVEPGFGGQQFEEKTYEKVKRLNHLMEREGIKIPIVVDGGVSLDSATKLYALGVRNFVIGTAIFGDNNIEKNIENFLRIGERKND